MMPMQHRISSNFCRHRERKHELRPSQQHHFTSLCVCRNTPWHIGCKPDSTYQSPNAQAPAEPATSSQTCTSLRDPYGTSRTGLSRLQHTLQRNTGIQCWGVTACTQINHDYCSLCQILVIDRYRFFITDTDNLYVYLPDNRYAEPIFIYCYKVNK